MSHDQQAGLPASERESIEHVVDSDVESAGVGSFAPRVNADARMDTFVIIPAYNEARCIAQVVREVRTGFPNVVVVDDGSTDETYAEANKAATFTLRHVINRGQGAALQTGLDFALRHGARYLITFDADGQHNPEDIDVMLAPLQAGKCDVVLGSRFMGQNVDMPYSRRLLLRLAVIFTRVVTGMNLTDTHNGFRALSRRAAESLDITLDGMAHASELLDQIKRTRLVYREVPVRISYTNYSLTKGQTTSSAIRILIHYLSGRFLK